MIATVCHVTAWAGRTKFQTDGFLFVGVYITMSSNPLVSEVPGIASGIVPCFCRIFQLHIIVSLGSLAVYRHLAWHFMLCGVLVLLLACV